MLYYKMLAARVKEIAHYRCVPPFGRPLFEGWQGLRGRAREAPLRILRVQELADDGQ